MPAYPRRSTPAPHRVLPNVLGRRRAGAVLILLPLALAGCDDPAATTAPALGVVAAAKPGGASLSVDAGAATLGIEQGAVSVTVTVVNPARATLRDVSLIAHVVQAGGVRREAAARAPINCPGAASGTVPGNSTCVVQLAVVASNTAAGSGTLAAGSADLEITLLQGSGRKESVLDSELTGVTLEAGATSPAIVSVELASTTLVIEGDPVAYTITISNPGEELSGVLIGSDLEQEGVSRAAGGTLLRCSGITNGILPTGTCTFDWEVVASNQSAGNGTLSAGGATLRVYVMEGSTVLDAEEVTVTLEEAATAGPEIASVQLANTSFPLNGASVPYTITITNPGTTRTGVFIQAEIGQQGASRGAGGFDVQCPGQDSGTLPSGGCSFEVTAVASNLAAGGGNLNGGSATLNIVLGDSDGTLDSEDVAITIVEPTVPYVYALQLSSYTLEIGGDAVAYTVTIRNPTQGTQSGFTFWATVDQDGSRHVADNFNNGCGPANSIQPGDCVVASNLEAQNNTGGPGNLVPGSAVLELEVRLSGTPQHTAGVLVQLTGQNP